ncbi:replication protein RepA [Isoptericola sp. NPDC019571]|uniref:replication protein RepA n=1 Tax=Isoptericola sp. NPDC019571 TaxID=3364008 RepID=UPI00378E3969
MHVHTEQANGMQATAPGYYPAIFAEFMLPYRDPGPFARWQQQHDGRTMTIHPMPSASPMGGDLYPYGVLPRRLLAWMATTAVATGSRHLDAGPTRSEFARTLGLATDGRTQERLWDQLARLVGATVHIQDATLRPGGLTVTGATFPIVEHYVTGITQHRHWDGQDPGIAITLSSEFFMSLTTAPVQVDLHRLRLLGTSPLRTDLYVWTCRQAQQGDRSQWHTTYETLAESFGSRAIRARRFREALRAAARSVSNLHPHVTITADDEGLKFAAHSEEP